MIDFYSEGLLAQHPTPKLEDHPLSAVRDFIQYICSCTPYLEAFFSIHNLKLCHAVVTRDAPNMVSTCFSLEDANSMFTV
jgi:hypothetical protein